MLLSNVATRTCTLNCSIDNKYGSLSSNGHNTLRTTLPRKAQHSILSSAHQCSIVSDMKSNGKVAKMVCRATATAGSGVFTDMVDDDVFKYYADGEWKKSSSGKSTSIINPSTRTVEYKVQGIVCYCFFC